MSRVSATDLSSTSPQRSSTDALNDLDLGTFLQLLITELQNQDPLNPLDNKDMLAQISQLREVGATDKLTETLNSVLLGQNIASSTNLIGAEVNALSDDNQPVRGVVKEVSIEDGQPKLRLELESGADATIEKGELSKGEYSYRVVWQDEDGNLVGLEMSGDDAVSTIDQSGLNDYSSIRLKNLPISDGPKKIYRTDESGEGDYRLVATVMDGKQSSYLDTTADDARSQTRQTEPFYTGPELRKRSFRVSLGNVSEIRAAEG
jgi:flagellar basal-body rod modification protein FlgD